jgi:Tol biopolymer transport system component
MINKLRYSTIVAVYAFAAFLVPFVPAQAGQMPSPTPEATPPRAKDGKKLLTAMDLLNIKGVGSPRISPDGKTVAYTVSETKTEKDKEWKAVTHIWVVPTAGGSPRQFTRGDNSCTSPEWTPDGKKIAFLTDREKAGERQVWMMYADGGEAWAVTSQKGGVSGFRISPDGKSLLFTAVDQPTKEEEDRKRLKDDTILIDQDIKMTHLWHFDIEKKEAKRLTEGSFTVSDPQWSPDGTQASFTARPTPNADDGGLADSWILNIATKEKRKVEDTPGSSDSVRWSPDGKWLAYTGGRAMGDGVQTTYLYVVPSSGGPPREISTKLDNNVGQPFWSPDGRTVYFSSNTFQAVEAFSINVESGVFNQLTRGGGTLAISDISSDGQTIIGTASTADRPNELFAANANLASVRSITDGDRALEEQGRHGDRRCSYKTRRLRGRKGPVPAQSTRRADRGIIEQFQRPCSGACG